MKDVSPVQALDELEHAENMPNTNEIAKHLCPHISTAARQAIMDAYLLYKSNASCDKDIALTLLCGPAYHGIINPYALKIDTDIQRTAQDRITSKIRQKGDRPMQENDWA